MSSSDAPTLAPSRSDELRQQVEHLMTQMDSVSGLVERLVAEGAGQVNALRADDAQGLSPCRHGHGMPGLLQ